MELGEFLNKDTSEKRNLISSRDLFKTITEEILAKILVRERIKQTVDEIAQVLISDKDIRAKINLTPFINILSDSQLPRIRKYLIIDILIGIFYRRDDSEKNNNDLSHLISTLKEFNDPFLITHSIKSDNLHEIFSVAQIDDLFQSSSEIELLHFSASSAQELVSNTVHILKNIPTADSKTIFLEGGFNPGYELFLASSLEGTFKSGGYLSSKKIGLILATILESNGFPSANPSINPKIDTLYSGFIEVENLLFTADPKHRDHAFHSFNVFLLGISILTLFHEVNRTNNHNRGEDFLCWVMSSFFHDVGYGIQKISKTTDKIKQHYRGVGKVKGPEFSFSESFRMYGENLIKIMNENLQKSWYPRSQYETIDTSLLESWEKRNHGLISALIMLKAIDDYKSKDFKFSNSYPPERWRDIFVRAGLAITTHTLPIDRNWQVDVDYVPNAHKIWNFKPNYLSYLLSILDSIEYLNRPRFIPALEGFSVEKVKDVELNLNVQCTYTNTHYFHLKVIAKYDNYSFVNLMETAEGMFKRLQHFISKDWGLTIILQTSSEWEDDTFIQMKDIGLLPSKPLIELKFQKKEIEAFLLMFESKLEEYVNKENELYFAFLKKTMFNLNLDPCNILKPPTTDYDTLMTHHYLSPDVQQEEAKLLRLFFDMPIINNFIPKTTIGFQNFIRWRK